VDLESIWARRPSGLAFTLASPARVCRTSSAQLKLRGAQRVSITRARPRRARGLSTAKLRQGAIHLNEAEFIFEVIDPESGQSIGEGQRGELVITNLGRAGMPVLRYRTGDLVELTTEPCACGRRFARIKGGVLGRTDDMIIVRGVNLYPSAIDNLIRGVPLVFEYEVEISRVAGIDEILVRIETADADSFEEAARQLTHSFRTAHSIRVNVEHSPAGSLPRYEFKSRRFRRNATS
jgi:phenylacetate-CoA ligase